MKWNQQTHNHLQHCEIKLVTCLMHINTACMPICTMLRLCYFASIADTAYHMTYAWNANLLPTISLRRFMKAITMFILFLSTQRCASSCSIQWATCSLLPVNHNTLFKYKPPRHVGRGKAPKGNVLARLYHSLLKYLSSISLTWYTTNFFVTL